MINDKSNNTKIQFKYIGLGNDLYNTISEMIKEDTNNSKKVLYVFRNDKTAYHFKEKYRKSIFFNEEFNEDQSLETDKLSIFNKLNNDSFLTESEFYEKLFNNKNTVIKEEKQSIFFYNTLTDELKKKLKINSYFDCIDIAYNYFNLFSELYQYEVDLSNRDYIKKWQSDIFETLKEVDRLIKDKLFSNDMILPYMLQNVLYINKYYVRSFDKIVFVNKFDFTPIEKKIYFEIADLIRGNILFLKQCSKNDFDEENYKLHANAFDGVCEDINLSEKVRIHTTPNYLNQMISLFHFLEQNDVENNSSSEENNDKATKKNYYIYDLLEKEDDLEYNLFNSQKLKMIRQYSMNKTKIYKILNILQMILASSEVKWHGKEREILFKTKDLFLAYKNNDFLKVFGIASTKNQFEKFIQQNYKYLSLKLLESEYQSQQNQCNENTNGDKLIKFFNELIEIYDISDLFNYTNKLSDIFNKSDDNLNQEITDKFNESLSEIAVIESFDFNKNKLEDRSLKNEKTESVKNKSIDWSKYFNNNISSNLLKLFLKYLDAKNIKLEASSNKGIFSYSEHSELNIENIIYINAQDVFPSVKVNEYLFSTAQRQKMGLPVAEDLKKIKVFQFLNGIFGANSVDIFYVKNLEMEEDLSGIIEDLKLKYNINNIVVDEISEDDEISIIKRYCNESLQEKTMSKFTKSKLEKTDKNLRLGFYDFNILADSEYDYYLEKHLNKKEVIEEIEEKIDNKIIGVLVHDIYEKIVEQQEENIKRKKIVVNENDIDEIMKTVLKKNIYKISSKYSSFYESITYKEIKKNVIVFLNELNKIIQPLNNFELYIEKKLYSQLDEIDNVQFAYKIDFLIVENNSNVIILDYKTSESNKNQSFMSKDESKQLIFYEIMLRNQKLQCNLMTKQNINIEQSQEKQDNKINCKKSEEGEIIKLAPHFTAQHYIYNAIQGKMKLSKTIVDFTEDFIREKLENFDRNDYYDLGDKETYFSKKYSLISRKGDEKND